MRSNSIAVERHEQDLWLYIVSQRVQMTIRVCLEVVLHLFFDQLQISVAHLSVNQVTSLLPRVQTLLSLNLLPHKQVFVWIEGHLLVNLILKDASSRLNYACLLIFSIIVESA